MNTHALFKFKSTAELAQWYDQKYTEMTKGWDCPVPEAMRYIEFMELPKDPKLTFLDAGCGQGHFTAVVRDYLKPEFTNLCGVDISGVIIEQAKRTYPGIYFIKGDIENTEEFWPMWYDYIASIGSVEHCVNVPRALRSIHSLLKDEGKFYALVPNEEWQHFDQPNEVTHTDEEWRVLFKQAGFRELKFMRDGNISHFLLKR